MASGPITSWQIEGENVEAVTDFLFLGSKITIDGDSHHEIRRGLLLGSKSVQFSLIQSLSCVQLFATPWTAARQASLSITNSQSLLKIMSIKSLMPSNQFIICQPILLLPSIFPIRQFFASSSETIGASALASVLPMNIQNWFPLGLTCLNSLQSKRLSRVSPTPQFKSINSSVLSIFYSPTLTFIHDYWKNHNFD